MVNFIHINDMVNFIHLPAVFMDRSMDKLLYCRLYYLCCSFLLCVCFVFVYCLFVPSWLKALNYSSNEGMVFLQYLCVRYRAQLDWVKGDVGDDYIPVISMEKCCRCMKLINLHIVKIWYLG